MSPFTLLCYYGNATNSLLCNRHCCYVTMEMLQTHCYATGTITLLWKCYRVHRSCHQGNPTCNNMNYSDLHSRSWLEMDIHMESTPCNSSHCYRLYTHKSDRKRAELIGQLALQTQLQISSQRFSCQIQVFLLWKQYLRHKTKVQLLKSLIPSMYIKMSF
jgi:hypothetical protein